ncbi:helix-turn-helix transcriptional regulator [Nesterenkonia ebinurensis]|uniref:helix-turn-helix transcriptional regulator n=1 Tax=Nesterenkonia ebinurensis TaxID=2608252 RepID=UPI00123D1AE2|nr:helix-turn-helix transcriptional regulator [Nesterenkonia ebinurensis]
MSGSSSGHAPVLEYRSSAQLPPGIADLMGYREEGVEPGVHVGVPSPYLTLIFTTDDGLEVGDDPGLDSTTHAGVLLGGLHTRPAYIRQKEQQSGFHLSVHPLAARALFGAPTAELNRVAIDGAAVLGPGAERLRQQLGETADWGAAFQAVHRYLRSRPDSATGESPRPEVVEGWRWMSRRRGSGTVAELAHHVGLGRRQLGELFRREVGMGPKSVNRLLRFQYAKGQVTRRAGINGEPLAEVAYTCGYADQSHMVRDFQQYIGLSPSQWLCQDRPFIQATAPQIGAD